MRRIIYIFIVLIITATSVAWTQIVVQRSKQTINSGGLQYFIHTVQRGQTLYSIAKAYNVSEEAIIDKNNSIKAGLQARDVLLIPTQETFEKWTLSKTQKEQEAANEHKEQDEIVEHPAEPREPEIIATGICRAAGSEQAIEIAMLLPLKEVANGSNSDFVDFYRGALVALEVAKEEGISTNISLISTQRAIEDIIAGSEIERAHLIIGPVYAENFEGIARYAAQNRVIAVSPLALMDGITSPYAFQVAPCEEQRYEKVRSLVSNPSANVILIDHAKYKDVASYQELQKMVGSNGRVINYSRSTPTASIVELFDKERENVVIAPIDNESAVEELLSRLSSINALSRLNIKVIGTPAWGRLNNINVEMFFKLNVSYPTKYHHDRTNEAVADFYSRYVCAYDILPNMFALRGFDVTLMFVKALDDYGENTPLKIQNQQLSPLQTKYNFSQTDNLSTIINREWTWVNHTSDYTIETK